MDWISVDERLPEVGEEVEVIWREKVCRAQRVKNYNCWHVALSTFSDECSELTDRIEYWQPLPDPPKKQGPFSSRMCINGDRVLMFEGCSIMYLTISSECIKDLCAWLNRKWNSK